MRISPALVLLAFAAGCEKTSASPSSAPGAVAAPVVPAGGGGAKETASAMYEVKLDPPAATAVGQAAVATVRLLPKGGYKVNLEYPIKLTVTGPAAATPARLELVGKDAARFDKTEAQFKPSVKLGAAGAHAFKATFKFSVCTDKQCELKSEELQWVAKVQ
ncbi:MAG: hypothetical protein IT371_02460 [Deltaproteobacteria bacterium]|nr:hypothetical protein [Deltaproteobacteria bacterium]